MLGYASATMTLNTLGHVFENRVDEVGSALDLTRRYTTFRAGGPPAPRRRKNPLLRACPNNRLFTIQGVVGV